MIKATRAEDMPNLPMVVPSHVDSDQTKDNLPFRTPRVTLRRLSSGENGLFLAHLERLDPETRRTRFGHTAGQKFLLSYAERSLVGDCLVEGLFVDAVLRGVGELRFSETDRQEAEAAFSVEKDYQDQGLGGRLFQQVMNAARNRGVCRLSITCLRDNAKIMALARKHGARVTFDGRDVFAELPARPADLSTLRGEWQQETRAAACAYLEWRRDRRKRWTASVVGADRIIRPLSWMFDRSRFRR